MKTSMLRSLSLLALASAALSAHAGLLGSTVNANRLYPNPGTVVFDGGDRIVGAGVEYDSAGFDGRVTLDLTDTTLTITRLDVGNYATAAFNGYSVAVVSGPAITGVTFAGGFVPLSYYVDGGRLYIDYSGVTTEGGATSSFSITTASISSVPGPAAALAFGVGLIRRRKRA